MIAGPHAGESLKPAAAAAGRPLAAAGEKKPRLRGVLRSLACVWRSALLIFVRLARRADGLFSSCPLPCLVHIPLACFAFYRCRPSPVSMAIDKATRVPDGRDALPM